MVDGNSTVLILSNQTYNNSIQTTNLTASFASETPTEVLNYWTSDSGLDTYLTSTVDAAVPQFSNQSSADSSAGYRLLFGRVEGHQKYGLCQYNQDHVYRLNNFSMITWLI